jgi:hypothetical protein
MNIGRGTFTIDSVRAATHVEAMRQLFGSGFPAGTAGTIELTVFRTFR